MRTLRVVAVLAILGGAVGWWVIDREPDWYTRVRYPLRYESLIRTHARNYDLDPALLAAVVYTESRFNPKAVSEAGAIGLMQLLPETARGIAVRTGGDAFVTDDLYDPEINVRYGSWYLRNLVRKYGDVRIALAAYHAGQGNVDSWRAAGKGIVFPETRTYVENVTRLRSVYARGYADELGL
ncbi:MAG: lytic transglycosylase domain-containing protein [Gaiellales bacterium]